MSLAESISDGMERIQKEIDRVLKSRHGVEAQERLYQAKVAVAGAGGMGSHTALSLARAGIGHIHLIDFDKVELGNLHRQQYFMRHIGMPKVEALKSLILEVNPFLDIRTSEVVVSEENICELFVDADIIIEAFDQPEAKAMLVNGVLELFPEKQLIACSGMAGYSDGNKIRTRKVSRNFYLCGDEEAGVETEGTLFSTRVSICAGHAANQAIELILDKRKKQTEA
ncbi:Probable adenylyltransferase/sulfurtransferase MoeZ [uncultured Roseburia sp.]|uniref:Sulfur carrier protein ThiS adenylyltransferase ThiF n=1 Tax=Brotonthovivens ammoniilytica TaxID=2981725 RepID=A0ABT2TQ35_9FIRM|nr:sulfur carrier protein ThiS adenylyltransferase ThiF [Brotonthovivens ammoniilytica]MCU6763574.1 sulfur carrier protein ThiS adenylyltransferase ThiF [Brotonthovivens ammoniilytica]SCJ25521.1 Probable adenylyltransferase/sulfurtransferase MoeZ [uncultured Roseburia sp.]